MRQDRNPKPRPPGFRNNVGLNRDGHEAGGNSLSGSNRGMGGTGGSSSSCGGGFGSNRPQFNSGRPRFAGGGGGGGGGFDRGDRGGRPQGSRPPQPRPRAVPKPSPIAQVPDRWKERRAMLKAAAWRFAKMVHQSPAVVLATEDPYSLIRVPDTKARQLAKKIIRLRRTRKPAASPPAAKREAKPAT